MSPRRVAVLVLPLAEPAIAPAALPRRHAQARAADAAAIRGATVPAATNG